MKKDIINITPAMAKEFLIHNASANPASETVVNRYVREMAHGTWHSDPFAICFDKSGRLVDGQEKLMAIEKSRRAQELPVITGCDMYVTALRASNVGLAHRIEKGSISLCTLLNVCFGEFTKTADEAAQYLVQHMKSLIWTTENSSIEEYSVCKVGIMAAIMVAYENGVSIQTLKDLCGVLSSKTVLASTVRADENFFALRTYLLGRQIRLDTDTCTENRVAFYATAQAIMDTENSMAVGDFDEEKPFPFTVRGLNGQTVYAAPVSKAS